MGCAILLSFKGYPIQSDYVIMVIITMKSLSEGWIIVKILRLVQIMSRRPPERVDSSS